MKIRDHIKTIAVACLLVVSFLLTIPSASAAPTDIDCGTPYTEEDNVRCVCDTDVLISGPLAPVKKYCCGYWINRKCLTEYSYKICTQIGDKDLQEDCQDCVGSEDNPGVVEGVWTAIGCIPVDHTEMIQTFIRFGVGLGGGFALIIILVGAFNLSLSAGDPKKTSEAKERITSALIGLLFIIFSVSILQLIGVQILRIPGFGE